MLPAETQTFPESPERIAPPPSRGERGTNSLIDNLKQFAPSIDSIAGHRAGSVIGPDIRIEGEVTSTGLVEVYGPVDGNIRCAALTVGESAVVHGNVEAMIVMINGRVKGNVVASEVELGPNAQVDGDIRHRTLIMAKGARFEGRSSCMEPAQRREKAPVARLVADAQSQRAARPPSAPGPQVGRDRLDGSLRAAS